MTTSEAARTGSSDAVIQTLKWTRRQGFRPVALRPRSKAAMDEKYVAGDYKPPDDALWSSRNLGIGVVCGPAHSGPLDVDLDCPEAIFFASKCLPGTTAIFGRASKRASHYLYRTDEPSCPKFALIDPVSRSTIIELRGDGGHQTVLPGSIHEDTGELIEWSTAPFPDVPRADIEELKRSIKQIAIATLIVRHLWMEGQRNEICKHLAGLLYYLEWPLEETCGLIQSVMEYSGDADRTRIKTCQQTYLKGEKGGKVTGANRLREILGDARVVDKILEWAGSETAAFLQDYNEKFAAVSLNGKFRIAAGEGEDLTFYSKTDFIDIMSTDLTQIEGKPASKAKIWLVNPRRRTYFDVDYIPGEEETGGVFNLWKGWGVEPSKTASCEAWKELLHEIICGADPVLYEWMLQWFANILREPRSKPLTAPVLIGRQGAGKSLLLSYFGKVLGQAYVVVTNEEHIYGRFNKHLATALLLHSEEALYGGDRKHRGIIKSLITDEYRMFEQKGVDAERIHNYLRLVLTSNEAHAAPAETDDRRFTVVDMGDRKGDERLFKAVMREMYDSGPGRLLHYLKSELEYKPEIPRLNIKNKALAHMKFMNLDPVQAWWFEALQHGIMLPDYLSWAGKPAGAEWPQVVSGPALHLAMKLHAKARNARFVPEPIGLAVILDKMLGMKLERKYAYIANPMAEEAPAEVRYLGTRHYTVQNMPELAPARAAFERYIGQKIEWPAPPEEHERPPYTKF